MVEVRNEKEIKDRKLHSVKKGGKGGKEEEKSRGKLIKKGREGEPNR